jgi:hypothetical protein
MLFYQQLKQIHNPVTRIRDLWTRQKFLKKISVLKRSRLGFEGFGVSSLFNANDYDKLMYLFGDIRDGNREKMVGLTDILVNNFWGKKHRNDSFPAPYTTSIDHNIITHPGIALMLKNITGEDLNRFLWIASGLGNSEVPTINSPGLENENARLSIETNGFFFASGTSLFQGGIFPKTIPGDPAVVVEFLAATTLDPNDPLHTVMWRNRIRDPSKYVYHYEDKTIYLHIHIIDARPMMQE